MNNVLLLGGMGFLGTELSEKMRGLGWSTTCLSRNSSMGTRRNFILSEHSSLRRILEEGNFSSIVNLIGNVSSPGGRGLMPSDRNYLFEQFRSCAGLLQNIRKVIHVGSCAEYGSSKTPYSENNEPQPDSDYGRGKLEETLFFKSLASEGAPIVILRPSIVFGAGQTGDMLVPAMIRAIKSSSPFVLKQPNLVRDFLYVKDFTNAVVAAIESPSNSGEIYNIGSGSPTYVWEFASELASALGAVPGQLMFEADASSEFSSRVPEVDVSLSEQELGWRSKFHLNNEI
jgi:nucleoside-diphosphate-sugar epimerase